MTNTGIVRTVRDGVPPLSHAWRVPVIWAALAGVGVDLIWRCSGHRRRCSALVYTV